MGLYCRCHCLCLFKIVLRIPLKNFPLNPFVSFQIKIKKKQQKKNCIYHAFLYTHILTVLSNSNSKIYDRRCCSCYVSFLLLLFRQKSIISEYVMLYRYLLEIKSPIFLYIFHFYIKYLTIVSTCMFRKITCIFLGFSKNSRKIYKIRWKLKYQFLQPGMCLKIFIANLTK